MIARRRIACKKLYWGTDSKHVSCPGELTLSVYFLREVGQNRLDPSSWLGRASIVVFTGVEITGGRFIISWSTRANDSFEERCT